MRIRVIWPFRIKYEKFGRSPCIKTSRYGVLIQGVGLPPGSAIRLVAGPPQWPSAGVPLRVLPRVVGRHKAKDIIMKREALLPYLGERSDNSLSLTLRST